MIYDIDYKMTLILGYHYYYNFVRFPFRIIYGMTFIALLIGDIKHRNENIRKPVSLQMLIS